mmetsp:Transcript_9626/g.10784  ORF Transcript_9626/g.10784 Transcript_9626/m.10784 type:complete len:125 (+) Transcript_9626:165-539(+)
MSKVELYPFDSANNAMFVILNQSDWKIDAGSEFNWISTKSGMKTNLVTVRINTVYGENICLYPPANLPIVSNTLKVVIIKTANHAKSLFEVPRKSNFVPNDVPGNTTNVIVKHKNTWIAISDTS